MGRRACPIASCKVSGVRAPARRRKALSLENASSIGEKSGEEDGRNRSWHPRASMTCRTFPPICVLKLSMITICPACRLGARICSIEISKTVLSADPSRMSDSPMPSRERAARRVILARRLRGIAPYARFPLGDRADIRVKAMLEPHSSMKISLLASRVWACSRQAARSASFCSLARNVFFFRVQSRCWIARLIEAVLTWTRLSGLPDLAMLRQCGIWMGIKLRLESCSQGSAFLRWASRNGFGFDVAGLASQLEIPLDRGS
jgi:hypothetical protein